MRGQGHHIFAEHVVGFATAADPRAIEIAARVTAPVQVAVCGRRGVGRSTVAQALDHAGMPAGIVVASSADAADVTVYVTAEVVKPEDRAAVAATRQPTLVVFNKIDSTSLIGGVPRSRWADASPLIGTAVEPMSGLLAVAALDDLLDAPVWTALRALAAHPDLISDASVDGFVTAEYPQWLPVSADVRRRLLDTLDVFGVALAVAAIRKGASLPQIRMLLRRVSGVDEVVDRVVVAVAQVRYGRVRAAVAELQMLAVTDGRAAEFLCRDDTVIAVMAAAQDMAVAAGLEPVNDLNPGDHLARALWWRRYRNGQVSALCRACGADIARGSLRLWSQAHQGRLGT
ncbi:MAG: hypothetical protein K2Q25_06720 [Mycobacteriaceae bacterium]|nr:hypothetical protein [Mycobacteriaceae bacterium]